MEISKRWNKILTALSIIIIWGLFITIACYKQAGSYVEKDGHYDVDTDLTHEEYEMISDVMKNLINNAGKNQ